MIITKSGKEFKMILRLEKVVEWKDGFRLIGYLVIFIFLVMDMVMSWPSISISEDIVTFAIILDATHKNIDLTHIIHEFWFGEKKNEEVAETLKDFHSNK